jgi:hypothetical protein
MIPTVHQARLRTTTGTGMFGCLLRPNAPIALDVEGRIAFNQMLPVSKER